jgi:hypothetical protein
MRSSGKYTEENTHEITRIYQPRRVAATGADGFQRHMEGVDHAPAATCSTTSCYSQACCKTSRQIEAQRCKACEKFAEAAKTSALCSTTQTITQACTATPSEACRYNSL